MDKIIFIRMSDFGLNWHGDHRSYKLKLLIGQIEVVFILRQAISVLNALFKKKSVSLHPIR